MGIHDREYYRDDTSRPANGITVTVWLIVLHVGLFFLLGLTPHKGDSSEIIRWGGFQLDAILRGEIWRLFTSQLIPLSDLPTVVLGMFLLYWAGRPVEVIYGPRVFLLFYFAVGLVAGLAKFLLGISGLMPHPSEIGLAAPLFAVLILFACHYPRQIVLLFFILPVQVGHLVAVLVGLYLFSAILSFAKDGKLLDAPSVLAAAAFSAFFYLRGASWFAAFAVARMSGRATRGKRLRIYEADARPAEPIEEPPARERASSAVDEHLEAKLDEVLEKLARFGPDRLSHEEQEILMRASAAYQKLRK